MTESFEQNINSKKKLSLVPFGRVNHKFDGMEETMLFVKSQKSNKKEDGKFHSKHVKHDPQAESARAVFGLKKGSNSEKW